MSVAVTECVCGCVCDIHTHSHTSTNNTYNTCDQHVDMYMHEQYNTKCGPCAQQQLMYIHTYVHVYKYIHMYIHVYTSHTHFHVYIHKSRMNTYTYTYMFMHLTYIFMYTYTNIAYKLDALCRGSSEVCAHIRANVSTYTCIYRLAKTHRISYFIGHFLQK